MSCGPALHKLLSNFICKEPFKKVRYFQCFSMHVAHLPSIFKSSQAELLLRMHKAKNARYFRFWKKTLAVITKPGRTFLGKRRYFSGIVA